MMQTAFIEAGEFFPVVHIPIGPRETLNWPAPQRRSTLRRPGDLLTRLSQPVPDWLTGASPAQAQSFNRPPPRPVWNPSTRRYYAPTGLSQPVPDWLRGTPPRPSTLQNIRNFAASNVAAVAGAVALGGYWWQRRRQASKAQTIAAGENEKAMGRPRPKTVA